MRILHLSSASTWRGGEQQIAYLFEELAQRPQVKAQWILCPKGSEMERRCKAEGWQHEAWRKRFSLDPIFAWRLKRWCDKMEIDLIHIHDPNAHSLAVVSADYFGLKVPFVLSRRVDFPVREKKWSKHKYNHEQVKRILCVSEAVKRIMQPAIVQKGKLLTVHSGVDPNRFDNAKRDGRLRREFKIHHSLPIIGNISALADHKDLITFLRVAKLLKDGGLKAHFVLIGEGSERVAIEDEIRRLGLFEEVTLTGFRYDVRHLFHELDVFLFTSKTEGLGTTVLDAFACGVPVVATAAGGVPELIRNGQTGFLSPVKAVEELAVNVRRILKDEALREYMVAAAKERMRKHFSKRVMAEKTLLVYREVLDGII